MNEAKLRQLSLLHEMPCKPLPKPVQAEVTELLTQLLTSVLPALGGESRDEQDQR